MKHTDFYHKCREIISLEYAELLDALKAHGNSYQWDEEGEMPVIAVNPSKFDGHPFDFTVNEASVIDDSTIVLSGENTEDGNEVVLNDLMMDVFVGQLSYITDSMKNPVIKYVDDVSDGEENDNHCEGCESQEEQQ